MSLIKRSSLRSSHSNIHFYNENRSSQKLSKSEKDYYDIFLSHSFLDSVEVESLASKFESLGASVYVDWIVDSQLDRSKVNKGTAEILKKRMNKCKSLFFATSEHSQFSKWMPWELGYFDGINGKVSIVPIVEDSNYSSNYVGQEYLSLYPFVTIERNQGGNELIYINEAYDVYVPLGDWLGGQPPYKRT